VDPLGEKTKHLDNIGTSLMGGNYRLKDHRKVHGEKKQEWGGGKFG